MLTPLNDITASSQFGSAGIVQINRVFDPNQNRVQLPDQPGVPEPIEGCKAVSGQGTSRFVNTGKGGLRPNPYDPLSNSETIADIQPPNQSYRP